MRRLVFILILSFLTLFTSHANSAPVYVSKDSRVYHHDRNCSELNTDNLIEFKSSQQADSVGAIPCKHCDPSAVNEKPKSSYQPAESKIREAEAQNEKTNHTDINSDLFKAVKQGDLDKVKNLLDEGANIEAKSDYFGSMPLLISIINEHEDIVEELLKRGANPNVKNDDGHIPIMMAAYLNNPRIVKMLIEYGADVNAKTDRGLTALKAAGYHGNTQIIQILKAGKKGVEEEELNKQAQRLIQSFDIRGIRIGMTVQKVKELFPEAGSPLVPYGPQRLGFGSASNDGLVEVFLSDLSNVYKVKLTRNFAILCTSQ